MHPFLLSGGQKRRLSVGTALVAGAPVLALDEPTFGQDRARADELLDLLRDLNDEGTTILVVTHDMQLVDRVRRPHGRAGATAACSRTARPPPRSSPTTALIEARVSGCRRSRRALQGLAAASRLGLASSRLADLPGEAAP